MNIEKKCKIWELHKGAVEQKSFPDYTMQLIHLGIFQPFIITPIFYSLRGQPVFLDHRKEEKPILIHSS